MVIKIIFILFMKCSIITISKIKTNMTGYRVSNSTSTGCFSVSLDFVATFKSLARWRI